MSYLGRSDYSHGSASRCGVLIVNLGTPAAPNASALRRYLAEFLADRRVIELPRAVWLPLLYGVILPFRAPRSAHAYQKVWTEAGSPLRVNSEALAASLGESLAAAGIDADVRLAMRYGSPSVERVLDGWHKEGLRRLLVLPLYPQYSATTTASVFDAVYACVRRWRWQPELRLITDYFSEDGWVEAIAQSIRAHWAAHGRGERLLMSFHGIPKRYLLAGDPYFCQCHASARLIAKALNLANDEWTLSFQSRVGREEWLRPYTDEVIKALPAEGVRRLDVICPGFAVDCLETLEEIAMQNAELFVASGGETLRYIRALNSAASHVQALVDLVKRQGGGWSEFADRETRTDTASAQDAAVRAFRGYTGPQSSA
ncbi:MAG: ferrochelatase [Pseudomarimonas sp.]